MDAIKTALRVATNPSDAQKEAGNYRKRHDAFHGLSISIENEKGSWRHGIADGKRWRCKVPADYGYIRGSLGADSDHIDCYLGPHKDSHVVFVVNQMDPRAGKFDEHKCMLGFRNEREALKVYDDAFSDGSGPKRRNGIETMSLDRFKQWLRDEETKKPYKHRPHRASGGSIMTHEGPVNSSVAGRTDHLPLSVSSGAYILPADIVSAYGEGNTSAGFRVMKRLFGGTPYNGKSKPYDSDKAPYGSGGQPYGQSDSPYNEEIQNRAKGGKTGTVPVVIAGGEYAIPPHICAEIGDGDIEKGHRTLDQFVLRSRKDLVKTLRGLPGPARD